MFCRFLQHQNFLLHYSLFLGINFALYYNVAGLDSPMRRDAMTGKGDKRDHKRLPLRFNVLCHKVGTPTATAYTGNSVNVSPGGMLMEVHGCGLGLGDLISIEMSVPPTEGLLEYGGRFTSYARVLRINEIANPSGPSRKRGSLAQKIALEFCESPKLKV